jgi:sigma-B regulation protein RsbU (phosphoserine phosphatase)
VIADVSDKGMPAALFMALTRSILRASVGHAPSPAEGIAHANRLLCADSTGGMFVTLFYVLLNPDAGEMTYVNAGHNRPFLYRAETDELLQLARTGMALGVIEDAPFEQHTIHPNPGDLLLLYTDGVTDATDAHRQVFGMERLQRFVIDHAHSPASHIVTALEHTVNVFTGSSPRFDDMTIVVVRCL